MPSNSLPDADLNLPEMKTKSPSCPAGGVHMYVNTVIHAGFHQVLDRYIAIFSFNISIRQISNQCSSNSGQGWQKTGQYEY